MNRERRSNRRLARGLTRGVVKAVSVTERIARKESIKSLMTMGQKSNNWKHCGRGKRRSVSSESNASGLSDLDERLHDFQDNKSRKRLSFQNSTMIDEYLACVENYGVSPLCRATEESKQGSSRTKGFFPSYEACSYPVQQHYNRSNYVWRRPTQDKCGKSSIPLSEPVIDNTPIVRTPRTPFKVECTEKVFEKVCDNHTEILLLGWKWLQLSVSILQNIFYSSTTVEHVEEYKKNCFKIEQEMVFLIGSSNFQTDYTPVSAKSSNQMPTSETILFVLFIQSALIERDLGDYMFLLGGVIGTMAHLLIAFKNQYPKTHRGNFGVREIADAGGDWAIDGGGAAPAGVGGGGGGCEGEDEGAGGDASTLCSHF